MAQREADDAVAEWELLFRPQGMDGGHKVFRHRDGRIAIADWSGTRPDQTDNGVLWVDLAKPIEVHLHQGRLYTVLPLLDDGGREVVTHSTLASAVALQKVGASVNFSDPLFTEAMRGSSQDTRPAAADDRDPLGNAFASAATEPARNTINVQAYGADGKVRHWGTYQSLDVGRDAHVISAALELVHAIQRGVEITPDVLYEHLVGSKPHLDTRGEVVDRAVEWYHASSKAEPEHQLALAVLRHEQDLRREARSEAGEVISGASGPDADPQSVPGYVLAFPGGSQAEAEELFETLRRGGNRVYRVAHDAAQPVLQGLIAEACLRLATKGSSQHDAQEALEP